MRAILAILGSTSVEGPVIEWVATHRKQHNFSDRPGDPHSPHVDQAAGWRGAVRGLAHAHVGWMFRGKDMANPRRYARDLLADRDLRVISRLFPLWVVLGLAVPFGLGYALAGTLVGGLTGLLWGGAVRVLLLHHATFCINSLCHFFGRRPFATGDESRNLAWLAPFAFGEAWHNNHHAFPTSARHGLGRWQFDPSAWLIGGLERCRLAWDVVRVSPAGQQPKRVMNPLRSHGRYAPVRSLETALRVTSREASMAHSKCRSCRARVWREGSSANDLCPGCAGPLEAVTELSESSGSSASGLARVDRVTRPRSGSRASPSRSASRSRAMTPRANAGSTQ